MLGVFLVALEDLEAGLQEGLEFSILGTRDQQRFKLVQKLGSTASSLNSSELKIA